LGPVTHGEFLLVAGTTAQRHDAVAFVVAVEADHLDLRTEHQGRDRRLDLVGEHLQERGSLFILSVRVDGDLGDQVSDVVGWQWHRGGSSGPQTA
jgi:hypothetical protein